jgi:hypothetical protein
VLHKITKQDVAHLNTIVSSQRFLVEIFMDELLQHQQNLLNTYRMEPSELEEFHQTTMSYDSTKIWNDEDFDILMAVIRAYQKATTISDYTSIQERCHHILTHFIFTRPAPVVTCVRLLRLAQWRREQISDR